MLAAVCHGGDAASLALSALGAATWVLDRAKIDDDVISMGRFSAYVPPDLDVMATGSEESAGEGAGEGAATAVASPRPTLATLVSASQGASQGCNDDDDERNNLATEGLSDLYWVVSGQRAAAGGAFDAAAATTGGEGAAGMDIKVRSRWTNCKYMVLFMCMHHIMRSNIYTVDIVVANTYLMRDIFSLVFHSPPPFTLSIRWEAACY